MECACLLPGKWFVLLISVVVFIPPQFLAPKRKLAEMKPEINKPFLQFSNFHFIPSFQIACYNNITEVWINVINENWNWSQQMNPKFNSIPTNQLRNGAEIGLIELNGFIGFSLRINQPSSQLIHHFSQPAIINST